MALDIGGFASSIFMRGIQSNYIPTTLLSMVDASIGGKTGINFMGKNTIGIIKQPLNVFINTQYLKTLKRR
jgi:3-dehydroquinate synthase